eukprot:3429930-Prymnesium_polylepis.1
MSAASSAAKTRGWLSSITLTSSARLVVEHHAHKFSAGERQASSARSRRRKRLPTLEQIIWLDAQAFATTQRAS